LVSCDFSDRLPLAGAWRQPKNSARPQFDFDRFVHEQHRSMLSNPVLMHPWQEHEPIARRGSVHSRLGRLPGSNRMLGGGQSDAENAAGKTDARQSNRKCENTRGYRPPVYDSHR
jgi:hypothetical protein